jgi:hypothetical protein
MLLADRWRASNAQFRDPNILLCDVRPNYLVLEYIEGAPHN